MLRGKKNPLFYNFISEQENLDENSFYLNSHGEFKKDKYFFCPKNVFIVFETNPGYFGYFFNNTIQKEKVIRKLLSFSSNRKIEIQNRDGYNIKVNIFNPGDIVNDLLLNFNDSRMKLGIFKLFTDKKLLRYSNKNNKSINERHEKNIWPFINNTSVEHLLSDVILISSSIHYLVN